MEAKKQKNKEPLLAPCVAGPLAGCCEASENNATDVLAGGEYAPPFA